MELLDFFEEVKSANIDFTKVENVEKKYNATLSEIAKGVISYSEIMNAEDDLHVSFSDAGIIPFVDCMDNDFIVYDTENEVWTKFNIVEKCKFGIAGDLEQLMK